MMRTPILITALCASIISAQSITEEDSTAKSQDSTHVISTPQNASTSIKDSSNIPKSANASLKDTSNSPKSDSASISEQQTTAPNDSSISNVSNIPPVPAVTDQSENVRKPIPNPRYRGIGLNLMVKLFYPKEVNDFMEDIWNKFKDDLPGHVTNDIGSPSIFTEFGFKLKGIVYVTPFLGLEPYGMLNYGGKYMRVQNYDDYNVNVNILDLGGGLNVWAKFSPEKRVSFKAGLGGYVCHTLIDVDGYAGEVKLTGIGYGLNILAGLDLTFRRIVANLDFAVPIGQTNLDKKGSFDFEQEPYETARIRYPSKYVHTGFEFRPGFTFKF